MRRWIWIFVVTMIAVAGCRSEEKRQYQVALYNGEGAGEVYIAAMEKILNREPDFIYTLVDGAAIREGALDNADVVILPGGGGSVQSRAIGEEGWKEIRALLERGGGYLGICAGAYLVTTDCTGAQSFLNIKTIDDEWARGKTELLIELTPEGREIWPGPEKAFPMYYENGPVIECANLPDREPYQVLAFFRSEICENGAREGTQINTPAILLGKFGNGRVAASSVHPELSPQANAFIAPLLRHLAN